MNGRTDPADTVGDYDPLLPDEYDLALYRIDHHERARLADTLGRVKIASAPI